MTKAPRPKAPTLDTITNFLDAAIAVSLAVENGADPADPAVQDQLNSLIAEFQPLTVIGTDAREVLSIDTASDGALPFLSYANGLGGDDLLVGDVSADVLVGGDGKDALSAGANRDALFGSAGDDILDGGDGRDFLSGGDDLDVLAGGRGRDTLDGGAGNDLLDGQDGRDILNGGTGVDTITGGTGRDTVVFDGVVFESAAVIDGDGIRQVENTPDILTDFTIGEDVFQFDVSDFNVSGNKKVSVSTAAEIRDGSNIIVLQDLDNDANAATAFNAGAAASLIAANVDVDGAGFFVYFNSALQINRLVYSENLNDATADIRVLANIDTLSGADAIAALDDFTGREFSFI
jgi:Ca2+-binding RTX toxin-like protein